MTEKELAELLRNNPDVQLVTDGSYTTLEPRKVEATTPKFSERDLQAAVIAECDRRAIHRPEYGAILAIPNGQYRQGQRMEPGLRPGIPNLFLPVARHGYNGLFIELKIGTNRLSEAQCRWIALLRRYGYRCEVIKDSLANVMETIDWYINGVTP